jgi:hypothetical protein
VAAGRRGKDKELSKNTSYDKMTIEHFGDHLLRSQDLDPVYTMLYEATLDQELLYRWLLAYGMCYSAGCTSWLSERKGEKFWDAMEVYATNEVPTPISTRWPRGRERRHFRGKAGQKAVAEMRERYPRPEDAIAYITAPGTPHPVLSPNGELTCNEVMSRVQEWPLHGPWIGFKMADLVDRVLGIPVDFTGTDVVFFDSPKKAAKQWFQQVRPEVTFERDGTYVMEACVHLMQVFGERLAPPRFERKLKLNEIETILCKWGSHMNWHYPVGIDTKELVEALEPWQHVSPTAWELNKEVKILIEQVKSGNYSEDRP